jgi:hypothetical protein
VAFQLTKRGFDVLPLAGGLERWIALDLPLERRDPELHTVAVQRDPR